MKYVEVTIETNREWLDAVCEVVREIVPEEGIEIIDPDSIQEMLWNTDPTEYADEEDFADALKEEPKVRFYLTCDNDADTSAGAAENDKKEPAKAEAENDEMSVDEALMQIKTRFSKIGIDDAAARIETHVVDDEDWLYKWQEYFVPTRLSEHVWVRPSWAEFEPEDKDDVVIAIDPGMAFGTGTHETTYLTLRLMDKYMHPGCSVLDVGCGSGILSIAAAKLGAGSVLGIDIDSEAVRVSRENIELNGVSDIAYAIEGDLVKGLDRKTVEAVRNNPSGEAGIPDDIDSFVDNDREQQNEDTPDATAKFDIIVANLLTELVIQLSDSVSKHLDNQGVFVSSGILDDHRERVIEHLEKIGFRIIEVVSEGGWCAIASVL